MKLKQSKDKKPKIGRKKQTKEASQTREIEVHQDYAGTEASPYREWLERRGNYKQDKEKEEPKEANPDVLPESSGLYFTPENDYYEVIVIKQMWDTFTPLEQEVLQMVGYEGRSYDNCAVKLGIKKGTVQTIIYRLRKKIKDCLTTDEFSNQ